MQAALCGHRALHEASSVGFSLSAGGDKASICPWTNQRCLVDYTLSCDINRRGARVIVSEDCAYRRTPAGTIDH